MADQSDTVTYNISLLSQANNNIAATLLPVMLFLSVLSVVGTIGNSLVCYIFSKKFANGTQNFLVICLAMFDLNTCLLNIPYEILDLRFYAFYVFDSDYICKTFKFINTFCNVGSIFILLIIAIDRYRKVCRPFKKQLRIEGMRHIFAAVLIASVICSSPSFFIYGYRTFNSTLVNGIVSRECSTPDGVSSLYPTAYNGFLLLNFIVISAALAAMYNGILREVKCRNKRRKTLSFNVSQVETYARSVATNEDTSSVIDDDTHVDKVSLSAQPNGLNINNDQTVCHESRQELSAEISPPDVLRDKAYQCQKQKILDESFSNEYLTNKLLTMNPSPEFNHSSEKLDVISSMKGNTQSPHVLKKNSSVYLSGKRVVNEKYAQTIGMSLVETTDIIVGDPSTAADKKRSPSSKKRRRTRNQTTLVAFSVTTTFILSYLPYLILMISKLVIFQGFDQELTDYKLVLYNLFLRTYFINSMCNPIIYGILNSQFRLEVRRLMKKLCC